jgi:2-dehydropantoate 2-reductase
MSLITDAKKLIDSLDPASLVREKKQGARPDLKIVFLGAGVVGGTVGAWIAEHYDNVFFLDQGKVAESLKQNGITTYLGSEPDSKTTVSLKVIDDLDQALDADVIVLGVKNYSLETVAKLIKKKMGDRPVIVGMQNGLENQEVLPKYFSKVIYCIVSFNAWMDELGVIGYQKKGPLHLGTLQNELQTEMEDIAAIFNLGVETHITHKIGDAAHCKLVINLTNSLTTLVGLNFREIDDRALFQKLLSNLTWEGVQIVKAAGYSESKLGGMPPWALMWAGSHLPRLITKNLFEKNVKKMVVSSMAQDIIQRGSTDSELESINGYILKLAEKNSVPAPFNRAIYELAKQKFSEGSFEPMDIKDVWAFVKPRL